MGLYPLAVIATLLFRDDGLALPYRCIGPLPQLEGEAVFAIFEFPYERILETIHHHVIDTEGRHEIETAWIISTGVVLFDHPDPDALNKRNGRLVNLRAQDFSSRGSSQSNSTSPLDGARDVTPSTVNVV